MIKLLSIVLSILFVSPYALSQKIEHREHKDFSIIKVKSGIKLFITQADSFSVRVEASKGSIHRIITQKINNTLTIYTKGKYRWANSEQRNVYVSMPQVLALTAESGSDITSKNDLKGDIIFLRASSGSDIYCSLFYNTIRTNAKNGGSITLNGAALNLNVKAESGGHVFNKKLQCEYADLTVSEGSSVEVNVSEWLLVNTIGGEIKYKGTPRQKEVIASKGGDVRRF